MSLSCPKLVELRLLDVDIEFCSNCRCDVMEIYDGPEMTSETLIASVCGDDDAGQHFMSTTNAMYIRFISDDIYTYQGFLARYSLPYQPDGETN